MSYSSPLKKQFINCKNKTILIEIKVQLILEVIVWFTNEMTKNINIYSNN